MRIFSSHNTSVNVLSPTAVWHFYRSYKDYQLEIYDGLVVKELGSAIAHNTVEFALNSSLPFAMMAEANTKSEAKEASQCMICMEYDRFLKCDIKSLSCSQVVCTECIMNLAKVSIEQYDCTTCRYVTLFVIGYILSSLFWGDWVSASLVIMFINCLDVGSR